MVKFKFKKFFKLSFKNLIVTASFLLFSILALLLTFYLILIDKIYPSIFIAGTNISFLTPNEAQQKLNLSFNQRLQNTLTFKYFPPNSTSPQIFEIKLTSLTPDIDPKIEQAFEYGHQKPYFSKINLSLSPSFPSSFDSQIERLTQNLNIPPIDSSLKIENQEITVTPSQNGLKLDEEKLKLIIIDYLNSGVIKDSDLPVKIALPKLSYDEALAIKKRLDQIKLNPLKLTSPSQTFTLDLNQILSLIDLENTESSLISTSLFNKAINLGSISIGNNEYTDTKLTLNSQKLSDYLKSLKSQIDQPVEEPLFNLENNQNSSLKPKIKEFRPPQDGLALDIDSSSQKIAQALLSQDQSVVKLDVKVVQPKNKLTNELGIKELIGRGESNFAGSIENRIFNVNLAASRINGVLIGPGETFSFDQTIGDVTSQTGYKQAYVIKSGRTVLDDGGGVCQVSTTLFRAVLNTGLPVVERTAHAYRVHYYEEGYPPGIDATVFYPSVDFKFKNDTGSSILIQAYTNGLHLTIDLFGTSDGRIATISKPIILSQTPPPPDIRQDDPTLPVGTVKQVDFSAWGANVVFNRTVTRNGQILIKETYKSNFRPWQAIYLIGTKTS